MDTDKLYELFSHSFHPSPDVRQAAESQLGQLTAAEGLASALLRVIGAAQGEPAVKQAVAIFFKNLVDRHWEPPKELPRPSLGQSDKDFVRSHLVAILPVATAAVRLQLIESMEIIVRADFPERWPAVLSQVMQLVGSGDYAGMMAGLAALHALVDWKGHSSQDNLEKLYGQIFPPLMGLANAALAKPLAENLLLVKTILKTVYSAIRYKFSTALLGSPSFSGWISVLTRAIQMPIPAECQSLENDDKDQSPIWKMKKWALHCMNKIFIRYGNMSGDSFSNTAHLDFAKMFMNEAALPVLSIYLEQIQSYLEGRNPITGRVFCLITDLLSNSIRHKKTWKALKAHIQGLVSHFLFPQLCFNDADQEMWEDEPIEYCRVKLDPFEEYYSRASASGNLLIDIIKYRKSETFMPVLGFINSVFSAYAASPNDAALQRQKDGALGMVGMLSSFLIKSELKDQMEHFVVTHVFPDLSGPQPFLRARACWVLHQLDDLAFGNPQNSLDALRGVMTCLNDRDLPVQVNAALALGALVDEEPVQRALPPYLATIMQVLMNLTNETDLDSIPFVTERFVSMFSTELTPFATQLAAQMSASLMRIMADFSAELADDNDDSVYDTSSKLMTAVGVMRAIQELADSLSASPEILAQLDDILLPMIRMILERSLVDIFEETFELICSLMYGRKTVSPGFWSILPLLHVCFEKCGVDYVQDYVLMYDNYVSYGSETLLTDPSAMDMITHAIQKTMASDEFEENDRTLMCSLIESMMLHCRGRIDSMIRPFLDMAISSIDRNLSTTSATVHHLEVFLNALYYNASLALAASENQKRTRDWFGMWFGQHEKFTRVHDKRLVILALGELFGMPFESLPAILKENWHTCMPIYMHAISTLPQAIEERRKIEKELEQASEDDEDDEYDDIYDEIHDDDDESAEDSIESASQKFLRRVSSEIDIDPSATSREEIGRSDGEEDDDEDDEDEWYDNDELEEEFAFDSPLDHVDFANLIQQTLLDLSKQQPASFSQLTSQLDSEQKASLQAMASFPPANLY